LVTEENAIAGIQRAFREELELPHVSEADIRNCIDAGDSAKEQLKQLAVASWNQRYKAERAFDLLDGAKKGVIVLGDLQRVARDILGEDITDQELIEMIEEVDRSGDGILFKEDFVRVARHVQL